jgi:hypothetical protein
MRSLVIAALACSLTAIAEPARAQVRENPAIITVTVLGTLGGVATSVGAIVYAVEQRAFEGPWVVASLFSSAICGAMTVSFAVSGFSESSVGLDTGLGMLFYAAMTIWPTYWTVRGALSDVDPGEKFEGDVVPEETEDPAESLELRSSQLPGAKLFTFGGSF